MYLLYPFISYILIIRSLILSILFISIYLFYTGPLWKPLLWERTLSKDYYYYYYKLDLFSNLQISTKLLIFFVWSSDFSVAEGPFNLFCVFCSVGSLIFIFSIIRTLDYPGYST